MTMWTCDRFWKSTTDCQSISVRIIRMNYGREWFGSRYVYSRLVNMFSLSVFFFFFFLVTGRSAFPSILWTAAWQNQQNDMCAKRRLRSAWAPAKSDQSLRFPYEDAWVLSYPLSAQRRLWSDWANVQADLSLRWAQISFCRFCSAVAVLVL